MATGDEERGARVTYDFEGEEENQLSIKEGELITVIGRVTPENWILAKNVDGVEGYIPDGYFEIVPNKKASALPGTSATNDAYVLKQEEEEEEGHDSMLLEHNDTYSLFAYQSEWFSIACIFVGALFSFMYSTPQVASHRWRLGICSWLCFVIAGVATYICGIDRNRFRLAGSSALVRLIVFALAMLLLFASYPIGIASALPCLVTVLAELRVHSLQCKALPKRITDEWCSHMFGGTENCPPLKLMIFFIVLALDGLVFGWGYVNGYNSALLSNDENPSSYLRPAANAFMLGFARIITLNLALILLLACRNICNCCSHAVRARYESFRAKRGGNRRGTADNNHADTADFVHRCFGYSIVAATFLHLVCVYFTYEDSLATHTFLDSYGWETFGTGWCALLLLASIVASSNETLAKTNSRLFHQGHWQSIALIIVLIAHGAGGISTYYWQIMVAPLIVYALNVLVRYCQSD
eukprot:CAMPEP_0202688666 /NCGR_PEP_ID=MMETSP1385-20130828/4141_1 /ASSEMBLY_ACC=CAM_ASM_000861 /TAXON_ID=933848 /ORGANISM="Elphidium margaritaceum" /LENGTH=468 /DNA_ID=CAMNT_0049343689 /DNA_START=35 /DNA_END=1441 /DNA_ORIENTATION=+